MTINRTILWVCNVIFYDVVYQILMGVYAVVLEIYTNAFVRRNFKTQCAFCLSFTHQRPDQPVQTKIKNEVKNV